MNRIQLASPALTAVFACLLAACSSDDDGSSSSATSASATSSTSATGTGGGSSVSSGGSTSSTGMGGGGGAGTGGGGAETGGAGGARGGCTFGDPDACLDGEYCDAPDCQTGTCAPIGVEAGDKAPVCGCDDVTYWNGTTAASHAMAVAASGECATGTPCGGIGNIQCAAGQSCNIALAGPAACAADASGQCWGMPTDCPIGVGFGANLSTCDGDPWCILACGVIKSGEPYFVDDTCPL